MEDGGTYRAIRKFDAMKNRYIIDDQILAMEASECLIQKVRIKWKNAHLHQNLRVYEGKKDVEQFDAIIHGDIAENTFVIVLEAKTTVYPEDLSIVLEKAELFKKYLQSPSQLSCNSGFNPPAKRTPFTHYNNVKLVLPCLAGRHFSNELINECCSRGIIPVFPSGSRYAVKMLQLVPGFIGYL